MKLKNTWIWYEQVHILPTIRLEAARNCDGSYRWEVYIGWLIWNIEIGT